MFKFHDFFDGLIGFDTIKMLGAQIDAANSCIRTPNSIIQLNLRETPKKPVSCYEINSHEIVRINIPVNIDNGDILVPPRIIQNCEFKETLTTAINGYAWTEVINKTNQDEFIELIEPIKVISFEKPIADKYDIFNIAIKPNSTKLHDIENLIRTEHMNDEERYNIIKLCRKYDDIFFYEGDKLTFTNQVKHSINTYDEIPVHTKTYRYPFIHKQEVQNQIDKMLKDQIIRASNSPWSSPIWIVPKKADASNKKKWRIVVDYRKVNEKTIEDRYPLPNITDILDKLGRCQYFSTLDLASGFHQIEMDPKDIQKTAFNVENGHYEYLRMPFGLKNAPPTFQRVMDNLLKGLQGKICFVYMDDIVIYSTSLQEHMVNLQTVFQRLRETNFKIQLDKSEFLKKEVQFLGHIITSDGVKPNPEKIRAITNYPIPKTTKEIKGFLGLLGYYRKFIKDFAKITKPFTNCLKKGVKIEHNETFIKTFEDCKNLLTNDPILQYPNFEMPFNLTTDASNYALGGILSQGTIGSDKPIAYASRTLNPAEQNYSTIEKELLAIVWATKYFRPYLYGRKFKIITDHKPLQWLFSLKEPHSRLVRWRLKLEEYDYEICYKKGKKNTNADALSRIEIHTKEVSDKNQNSKTPLEEYIENFNDTLSTSNNQNVNAENNLLDNDSINDTELISDNISIIANASEIPDPENLLDIDNSDDESTDTAPSNIDNESIETAHTSTEDPVQLIQISEKPLNYFQNQIIIQTVNMPVGKPTRQKLFAESKTRVIAKFAKDQIEKETINFFKNYVEPYKTYAMLIEDEHIIPTMCNIIKDTFKNASFKLTRCNSKLTDIQDRGTQKLIIQNNHEGKRNHRGITETESQIRQKYYWPNLKADIQNYINSCEICQTVKYERNPHHIQLKLTPTPTKPFEVVHLDTLQIRNQKFLTIIDSFSKYGQAYSITSASMIHTIQSIVKYMSHHGLPLSFISDNGTEFKNKVMDDFIKLHKINIHYTTPRHPNSNGTIERFHSTVLEHLRVLNSKMPNSSISELMPYAIWGYNHSIHSTTKHKPIDIINGHLNTNDPFDIDLNQALTTNYIELHKEKVRIMYEQIHARSQSHKENVITRQNKDRTEPPNYNQQDPAYRAVPQIRDKTGPRYLKETITSQDNIKLTTDKKTYHKQSFRKPNVKSKNLLQADPVIMDPCPGTSTEDGNN